MKKLLLALSALLVAVASQALPVQTKKVNSKPEAHAVDCSNLVVQPTKAKAKAATLATVVDQQPDGELFYLSRTNYGYYFWFGGIQYRADFSAIVPVVEDAEGNWWLKNLIPFFSNRAWIKAEKNGSKLTITGPQALREYYVESINDEAMHYAVPMVFKQVDEERGTYVPAPGLKMEFNVSADGVIDAADFNMLLGVAIEDNSGSYNWMGYGGFSYSFYRPEPTPTTAPPADAQVNRYAMQFDGNGQFVNIATAGSDIYFQGLSTSFPTTWVKGEIVNDGDAQKVVIPNTYLGPDFSTMYYVNVVGATMTLEWNEEYQDFDTFLDLAKNITLDYDPATGNMETDMVFVFNPGLTYLAPFSTIKCPTFTNTQNVKYGRPRNPEITYVYEYKWLTTGIPGGLIFNFYAEDEFGNLLDKEKLFWRFYSDGKLYTFEPEDYWNLPGDGSATTQIPWGYWDNWDFMKPMGIQHDFCIYVDSKESYGIQTIYVDGDTVLQSDICTVLLNTSGVDEITAPQVNSQEFFDLTGKPVAPDAKGLVIVRSTLSDGSVKTTKQINR